MAIGTITVVGVAVIGSLTLLPALLSLLGSGRTGAGSRSWAAAGPPPRPSRVWAALIRRVVRRPVLWGGAAALALLALASPALGCGSASRHRPAQQLPWWQTLDRIDEEFPGPVAGQRGRDRAGPDQPAGARAHGRAGGQRPSPTGPIRDPVTAAFVAHGRGVIMNVPLAGNGSDNASTNALLTLRDQVLPATLGTVHGLSYAVTGNTASNYDWSATVHARTPIVLAVVCLLAFCVMLIAFRSVLLPLISIGLNLLSVGAAYGLITLIFQDGHLEGLLSFTSYGAIADWVPLFMFVLLFGLSMDYHVFILSRVRERRWPGRAPRMRWSAASPAAPAW